MSRSKHSRTSAQETSNYSLNRKRKDRSRSSRDGSSVDYIVWMIIGFMVIAWLLGNLWLALLPKQSKQVANRSKVSNTVAIQKTKAELPVNGGQDVDQSKGVAVAKLGGEKAEDAQPQVEQTDASDPSATEGNRWGGGDTNENNRVAEASDIDRNTVNQPNTDDQGFGSEPSNLTANNAGSSNLDANSEANAFDQGNVNEAPPVGVSPPNQWGDDQNSTENQVADSNVDPKLGEIDFGDTSDIDTAETPASAPVETLMDIPKQPEVADLAPAITNVEPANTVPNQVDPVTEPVTEIVTKKAEVPVQEEPVKKAVEQEAPKSVGQLKVFPAEVATSDLVFRDWTSNKGSKASMAFLRHDVDGYVWFVARMTDEDGKKVNRKVRLPVTRLSEEDRSFVKTLSVKSTEK